MRDREISLRELVWEIILDWRHLVVCVVIFAIVMSVLQYTQAKKSYSAEMETYQKQLEAYETEEEGEEVHSVDMTTFTADELQQINDAKSLQGMLNQSRTYMRNSILMNTNAYKVNVLILEYYVDSNYKFNYVQDNEPDYTSDVVRAYGNYARNGELARLIKETLELDYELRYIEEVIDVTEVQYNDSFTIEIICVEGLNPTELSTIVKDALDEQTARISERIGMHSLKLISENNTVKTDTVLANQQQTYQNMINNYRNQLNVLKNGMTDEQLEMLGIVVVSDEEEEEGEETGTEVELVEPVKPGFTVRYLLLGFLVGIFVSAVWTTCKILFASRLQTAKELSDIYGLRVFGVIPTEKKCTAFDVWIIKMRDRHKKQMTPEGWLNVICANIELACKDRNLKKVYLTGSEWEKLDSQLIERLAMNLKEIGVAVSDGGNVCYDMTSLRNVHEVGTVILLEQENVSIYREIEKEIKTLEEQKVNVLGCVGIG